MTTISGTIYDDSGNPTAGRVVRVYRRDTGAFIGGSLSGDSESVPGDPLFGGVAFLLLGDGDNLSTDIFDSSASPKTVTISGNTALTTEQSKFGGSAIRFDGSGDYLSASHASFAPGTGDFTAELWVNLTRTSSAYDYIFQLADSGSNSGIMLRWTDSGFGLVFQASINDSARVTGPNRSQSAGAWRHIAFTRQSGTCRLFWDGVLLGASTNTANVTGQNLRVGAALDGSGNFQGDIDSVRYTVGVARYTTNFTAPSMAFPSGTPGSAIGQYLIDCGTYTGEVQRIVLDDDAGTLYNDIIHRVLPG